MQIIDSKRTLISHHFLSRHVPPSPYISLQSINLASIHPAFWQIFHQSAASSTVEMEALFSLLLNPVCLSLLLKGEFVEFV